MLDIHIYNVKFGNTYVTIILCFDFFDTKNLLFWLAISKVT